MNIKRWFSYNPPRALTMEEWGLFDKEFKKNAPIRYFIKNVFLTKLKLWKRKLINDPIDWVRYRTTRRFHIINTGLKPGYYDKDWLMLHGNFALLKNYVEVECASLHNWNKTEKVKDAGIKHLEWEISLGDESPKQSAAAKEILELYRWWTAIRPNRVLSPSPKSLKDLDLYEMWNAIGNDQEIKNHFKEQRELEAFWRQEDDDMLIRLIKIRHNLWT